jgi:hypothetical protein
MSGKPYVQWDHGPLRAAAAVPSRPARGRALLVVGRTSPSGSATNQAVSLGGRPPYEGTTAFAQERSYS